MATITAGVRDALITIYIGMFKEAPGKAALSDMVTKYESGLTQKQIATELATSAAFQNEYPASQLDGEFADELVEWLADEATAAGKAWATNWIVGQLGAGKSKAHVIVEAVNALRAATNLTDFGAAQDNLNNKLEVARYYAVTKEGADSSANVIAGITSDDATVVAAKALMDAVTYTLTNDVDVATANVFNSQPLYTPGGNDFINSLQDEDTLTGVGENPTLNVILGSVNDSAEYIVAPVLNNIETVNVQITGGNYEAAGINFQDATGLENLNLNRLTATNGDAWFIDLDRTTTNLQVNNVTRGGDVYFDYREEVLTETDEQLNLGINNARVNSLWLVTSTDGGADDGYFFETIDVTTTGNNDIDMFFIQANGREDLLNEVDANTTRQVLNLTANGTPNSGSLEINHLVSSTAYDEYYDEYEGYVLGIDELHIVANARVDIAADKLAALNPWNDGVHIPDVDTITITGAANVMLDGVDMTWMKQEAGIALTIDGSTMTGNLKLGVETPSDSHFSGYYEHRNDVDLIVESGSGNDQIHTYGALAGSITTNDGNDIVMIRDAGSYEYYEEYYDEFMDQQYGWDNGAADVEGVSVIDTGAGNDTVVARNLWATATDSDQVENEGYDDVQAARIDTGAGNDTVTVHDMLSNTDWDNKNLEDANFDDLFVVVGASISTGAGNDVVNVHSLAEGAMIDTGADDDVLNVELTGQTVMAGDTDADQETVRTATIAGTKEVQIGDETKADRLGAVIDMGEGDDVANFIDSSSDGNTDSLIVGRDAELRSAEVMNVVALDEVDVTVTTSAADQDPITAGVQMDVNANIIGTQILNLTVDNQINAATAALTSAVGDQNDNNHWDGQINADIMRFDSALEEINLVSNERVTLLNPAQEIYEAGTETDFELYNLRNDIALSLVAHEATGVDGLGKIKDDTLLAIDWATGVVTTDSGASDVRLDLDYDNARGLNDSAVLDVGAASGAFDLDLTIGATTTDVVGNAASASDDDARRVENFAVKFADAHSHSIDANGYGDVDFRSTRAPAVAGDVSSTAATSFTVWSAAGAGKTIAIDNINADAIAVKNVDGTAVTAANVVLRVDAENNYHIDTGSGSDIIDMRLDTVRADDQASAVDRADHIHAGAGRDLLIVSGDNHLGRNDLQSTVPATLIDDDVFDTMSGVEEILVHTDFSSSNNTQMITLDEDAETTGVDTIRFVGEDTHTVYMVLGDDFSRIVDGVIEDLVIDAEGHEGVVNLTIENKDDDGDADAFDLDIRLNIAAALAASGTDLVFANTGTEDRNVALTLTTAHQNVATIISDAPAAGVGTIGIQVIEGSIDSITLKDGEGNEGAMVDTYTISNTWTEDAGEFLFDASAIADEDDDTTTGGAYIDGTDSDAATLTIKGTQNDDEIVGSDFADVIDGNDGDDFIYGGLGADTLNGGTGDDVLFGEEGNDTINGGAGDDIIRGGDGADTLTGGAGDDTFVYGESDGSGGLVTSAPTESSLSVGLADTITDFVTGEDVVEVHLASNGNVVNLGRFANVNTVGAGNVSLEGNDNAWGPVVGDAFYAAGEQVLVVDIDGSGDATAADLYIASTGAVGAGDINYIVSGAATNDVMRAGQGTDQLWGNDGDDTFVAMGAITAADRANYIAAGSAAAAGIVGDLEYVMSYNELLTVRSQTEIGADTYDGGTGTDTLHTFGTASLVDATLNSIENIVAHSTLIIRVDQLMDLDVLAFFGDSAHTLVIVDTDGSALTAQEQEDAFEDFLDQAGQQFYMLGGGANTSLTVGGETYEGLDDIQDYVANLGFQEAGNNAALTDETLFEGDGGNLFENGEVEPQPEIEDNFDVSISWQSLDAGEDDSFVVKFFGNFVANNLTNEVNDFEPGSGNDVLDFSSFTWLTSGLEEGNGSFSGSLNPYDFEIDGGGRSSPNDAGNESINGHIAIVRTSGGEFDSESDILDMFSDSGNNDDQLFSLTNGQRGLILAGAEDDDVAYLWNVYDANPGVGTTIAAKLVGVINLVAGDDITDFDASNFVFSPVPV